MFQSQLGRILLSVSLFMFVSSAFLLGAIAFYLPDTPIGLAVFETSYKAFPFKKAFLDFYSPADRNYGVNTRSNPQVDEFLIQRIEASDDKNEVEAIAHYFTLQSKERNYGIFINVSDRVKPTIINHLIKELDNDNSNLSDKIMLLETTRTGKRIGKGAIEIENKNMPDFPKSWTMEQRKKLFDESLAATGVKQKYQDWWNLNLSWEEKRKINPLEGTNIKVSQCCG